MADSINGQISILTCLALQIREDFDLWLPTPKSLREIGIICNTLDQQLMRRFADDHPYLILQHTKIAGDKHVLGYTVPHWLHDFPFDPHRSQSLYLTSLVIGECQKAIEALVAKNSDFYPLIFFRQHDGISGASHLLEHVKNGSDSNDSDLLLFLGYLSEIPWFDIYTQGWGQRRLTCEIIHWVCTTLVR